jgi:hypothetical protein
MLLFFSEKTGVNRNLENQKQENGILEKTEVGKTFKPI